MTTKDIIAQASTIGDILKMMPDVNVDDETIGVAERTKDKQKKPPQKLGERLLEMGVITQEQLAEAVEIQTMIRETKDIEKIDEFLQRVKRREALLREQVSNVLDMRVPRTGT